LCGRATPDDLWNPKRIGQWWRSTESCILPSGAVETERMKILYEGDKHRSLWRLGFEVAFGLVFAALAIRPVFGKDIGLAATSLSVLFAGLGLWMIWSAVHTHLTLPIDVSIKDGGYVQVRPRSGEPIVIAASAFKHIRYRYEGPKGTLKVTADTRSWSLPVSEGEADAFIGALLALNPQIQVERKEDTTAA
jgi:hypothetical protein